MELHKLQSIIDFTKTDTWWYIKELFQEKESKVLTFMRGLDLDEPEDRKKYKKRNDALKAFDSLILELESLWINSEKNLEIERMNKEIDEYLLPTVEGDIKDDIDKEE